MNYVDFVNLSRRVKRMKSNVKEILNGGANEAAEKLVLYLLAAMYFLFLELKC